MKFLGFCVLISFLPWTGIRGTEFTVVAYNVENLFDLDGISLFPDYAESTGGDLAGYGRRELRTKLEAVGRVLSQVEDGKGPAVILFQELEADFTPDSGVADYRAFFERFHALTTADMLGPQWKPEFSGLPAEAWLLKQLSDLGMDGYSVAVAPAKPADSGIAHSNALFSRFPITEVRRHAMPQARDLLEVHLDVDGHGLILLVNHWKSGASNPDREPVRVENARVLRERLDALLEEDPFADIIIGGDLNSHYNHSRLFPGIQTGINDILGSQGDELALQRDDGPDLYNLWFELPPEARFSEVWRGRKGTLMHLILSRGLYDSTGISYVDGSFRTLTVPGVNADRLGRPVRWTFAGRSGGGASDHLPLAAAFRTSGGTRPGVFEQPERPSSGDDAPDTEYWFDYSNAASVDLPGVTELADAMEQGETGRVIGRLFSFEARLAGRAPLEIEVLGRRYPVYVPDRALFRTLRNLPEARTYRMTGELTVWNDALQWIVYSVEQ